MNTMALRTGGLPETISAGGSRAARSEATLRLEILTDTESFLALRPHWDALLEKCAVRTPFMRWDWLNIWREEFADEHQLAVGVVRDGNGVPRAIAPMALGRGDEGARKHLRLLSFMGCLGPVTTEGMDFLIAAGEEALLAPVLAQIFRMTRDRWDSVLLPMMHEESVCLPFIRSALEQCACGAALINRMPSRCVHLPETWEDLELARGGSWRSKMRRKWKKIIDEHGGRTLDTGASDAPEQSFDMLLALHARRWTPEQSRFLDPAVIGFHRRLVRSWLPSGRIIIPGIELDGEPAAASYCMVDFGRLWLYQAGWNEDYKRISIGKVSTAWAIRCALQRGLKVFDFLPGDAGYKREWANAVRFVVDLEAFNPQSLRALAFRVLRGLKRMIGPPPAPAEEQEEVDT